MSDWTRRKFITVTTVAGVAASELAAQAPKRPGKKGPTRYAVHPAVGVARLGNSPEEFYLEPETIGGLPIECSPDGTPRSEGGKPVFVKKFKDAAGRIKRQGAQFRVYAFDSNNPDDPGREVTLNDSDVESIEWTVHVANKKAVWYNNAGFIGNVYLAGDPHAVTENANYYPNPDDPPTPLDDASLRNWYIQGEAERQKQLIIDPGPRTVSRAGQKASFSRTTIPNDYPHGSFPPIGDDNRRIPYEIDTLGDMMMARSGRLVVLGGFGRSGGQVPIATYTGQDTWYDDIADGPVWCRLKLKGQAEPVVLTAWALVGSPKYAPQLRNISTLDDVMFDVGVRYYDLVPELYRNGGYNPNYLASYERDVEPILERIGDYIWVANVQSMVSFISPRFNPRDASEANRRNREIFFSYFRDSSKNELSEPHQTLFHNRVPMVPLNSGSNSVTNEDQDKYMGLTRTQYFLVGQWAKGKFTSGSAKRWPNRVHPLDQASVGNCVGHPMSPGIETTWTMRNPVIYSDPYRIKIHKDEAWYREHGLGTLGDETGTWYTKYPKAGVTPPAWLVAQDGCEPGDLTKRMSGPWVSDFYQCSVEYTNFSDPPLKPQPNTTAITEIPSPPTYYTYWWPPQAPMHVLTGPMTAKEQADAGVPAGFQVYYTRGANNIGNLVISWSYMGFIVNENDSAEGRLYPYFVEQERNHDRFVPAAVAVGSPINQMSATGSYGQPTNYFTLAWFMKEEQAIAECDGVPPDDPRCGQQ
ncbi:MAG TPA: CTQ-dependent lysine 6-oxidase LodA [Thermoanaerobaculia bacterium]|nr:CTQ-dependent lysine 6-oxidase LodA [Thermoanaerobaculia bacterium]